MSVPREFLTESGEKAAERVSPVERPGAMHPANANTHDLVAEGLARLLEGQRRFAEEFGLQYGRVFRDGYESYIGPDSVTLIRRWLSGDGNGAGSLDTLFRDLAAHQLALLSALDSAVCDAVDGVDTKMSLWRRALRRLGLGGTGATGATSDRRVSHQLRVVTPAFVWGYVQARQAIDQTR